MSEAPTAVLLIEDEAADAGLIQAALAGGEQPAFRVDWQRRLADGLRQLDLGAFEVVVLDLRLPDAKGIEVFERVAERAPNALILVLTTAGDEAIAREAVGRGADDYLVKGHAYGHWLPRALRYLRERRAIRDALVASEARFRAMSDASPLGIFVSDALGNCTYTNNAYEEISGLSPEKALGRNWITAIHPEDRLRVLDEWHEAARRQAPFQTECRFLRHDQGVVWIRLHAAAMLDGNRSCGYVQTLEDITERKSTESVLRAAEEALFEEKERAQVTLNSIGDAVMATDVLGRITYLNQAAEAMTGWSREEAFGRPISEVFTIIDGTTRLPAPSPAERVIAEDRMIGLAANCVLVRRDGLEIAIEDSAAPIHNRNGRVAGAVIVFHDVSESRAMTQRMAFLAQHDFLTGLPNRVLLMERISQAIGNAHRHHKQVALAFVDIDYFKEVNDSLGHVIGDRLLQSVAERLVACVRATDTVCRQGGDEFVILLAEIDRPQDAALVAEKLLAAFSLAHAIDGHELLVTLSIGISVFPDDGSDVDQLMQNADTAMYLAKASGRDNYRFFTADMSTHGAGQRLPESRP